VKDMKPEWDPGTPEQVVQMVLALRSSASIALLSFPEEKLGVGAKWESKLSLAQQSTSFEQKNIFTIESIKGDDVVVNVELVMSAPPQKMTPPGAPPEVVIELVKMQGSGKGQLKVNLKTQASELTLEQKTEEHTKATGTPGGPAEQESSTEVKLSLTQKAAE
ncbi:MAG: DUF6263 family protein, partial [Polyangiaceae bacterium]|nr:DUF6263 family protein [Polyangiaceae bacterium]